MAASDARTGQLTAVPGQLSGWGGGDQATVSLLRAASIDQLTDAVHLLRSGVGRFPGAISRGLGRSYGDAAQMTDGLVLDLTGLAGFELDAADGVVTARAGVTLAQLLDAVTPAGWIVPVVPGTQHVTVGGAIASDIHGKNHGVAGTFGAHVLELGLLTGSGEVLTLEPGDASGLFEATLGGMGLTGVILWARIQLRAVPSSFVAVDTDRAADIDQALALLSGPGGPHRVAWLDLLGSTAGRGVVTRADHAQEPLGRGAKHHAAATVRSRATVPHGWPDLLLRASTVRAFNELRFRACPQRERGRVYPFAAHMFPLDGLDAWPRLYGPAGFLQYQLAVPHRSVGVLQTAIESLRRARVPCYLCVLKDFGEANGAPLSFPIAGWTITFDLPRNAPGLEPALQRLDELVAEAGGRVYFSKDVRMRADAARAMYPRLGEWREIRDASDPDGIWRSDMAIRNGLVDAR